MIFETETSSNANVNSHRQVKNFNNINLPKISLPNFDGRYEHWLPFRDIYLSLIHNNSALSEIERFHYLKASLIEDAAKLIENVEITQQNYNIAWQSIVNRYENTKQIIKNYARALLNLPFTIKSNIPEFLDTIQKKVRALVACKQPV